MTEDLFSYIPRARNTDPPTSHIAAERAETFRGTHLDRIVAFLKSVEDGTKDEIAAGTGLDHVAVARRMIEGVRKGVIQRTDKIRFSRGGNPETVWRAA